MENLLKYSKRFTILVISFSLLFIYVPKTVFASNSIATQAIYATSDMRWYDENETEFSLTSSNELEGLAQLVNEGIADFSGKTIYLSNDIDIGGIEWIPIGHTYDNIINNQYFMGTFDGQGYTVKNLTINQTLQTQKQSAWGLFGFSAAMIKNLKVTGSIQMVGNAANYIGGIAGMVGGNLENSTSSVAISINGYVNTSSIGGLVGDLQGGGYIVNSIFDGSINIASTFNGSPYVGGIVGTNAGSTVKESVNKGNIDVVSGYGYAGGIVGQSYSEYPSLPSLIDNSYNTGTINFSEVAGSTGNASVGGITGSLSANGGFSSISNSFSIGNIGHVSSISKIGEITGSTTSVGGLVSSSNNYYIEVPGANHSFGFAKTIEEMTGQPFVDLLNAGGNKYILSSSGLPILAHQGFQLTFVNGVGNGIYAEGIEIMITADKVPDREWFLGWTSSNGGVFGDKDSLSTTFTMPGADTTITAVFEVIPLGNYKIVDDAIAKIPSDLNLYLDKTVNQLQKILDSVDRNMNVVEQGIINSYAADINKAIDELVYKDADYSKVDAALSKLPSDMSLYTNDSIAALDAAVNAIMRNKNISEQLEVDMYATNILIEIDNLKRKDTQTPNTSDNTNMNIIIIMFITSLGIVGVMIKKKGLTK